MEVSKVHLNTINSKNDASSSVRDDARYVSHPQLREMSLNSKIRPLQSDIVSFKSGRNTQKVKKSDFKGIDLATVEKYRLDISGYKTPEDLQSWAQRQVIYIGNDKDFGGRNDNTKFQRRIIVNSWFMHLFQESKEYSSVMQLAILDSITKNLKPDTDDLPPVLEKKVLSVVMREVNDKLSRNPKENINIKKLYESKLLEFYSSSGDKQSVNSDYTGWIIIPSQSNDSDNFETNVNKLKQMSYPTWCTKAFSAGIYLKEGDFHIYLDKGNPVLGIKFMDNKIEEIQGKKNNSNIPVEYLGVVKEHIRENNFELMPVAEAEMKQAREFEDILAGLKKTIGAEAVNNNDIEKILPAFGIDVQKDVDGKYIISKYDFSNLDFSLDNKKFSLDNKDFSLFDIGIDENKLLKDVKEITGALNLSDSSITKMPNLEIVGGNVLAFKKNDVDLSNLKKINGSGYFMGSKNIRLDKLETVAHNANFYGSDIDSLPCLKFVGEDAIFANTKIKSLENLEYVGKNLKIKDSLIADLPKLKHVGGEKD